MKCKNYIFTLLVAFATLLSWWVVPSLVKEGYRRLAFLSVDVL